MWATFRKVKQMEKRNYVYYDEDGSPRVVSEVEENGVISRITMKSPKNVDDWSIKQEILKRVQVNKKDE